MNEGGALVYNVTVFKTIPPVKNKSVLLDYHPLSATPPDYEVVHSIRLVFIVTPLFKLFQLMDLQEGKKSIARICKVPTIAIWYCKVGIQL